MIDHNYIVETIKLAQYWIVLNRSRVKRHFFNSLFSFLFFPYFFFVLFVSPPSKNTISSRIRRRRRRRPVCLFVRRIPFRTIKRIRVFSLRLFRSYLCCLVRHMCVQFGFPLLNDYSFNPNYFRSKSFFPLYLFLYLNKKFFVCQTNKFNG